MALNEVWDSSKFALTGLVPKAGRTLKRAYYPDRRKTKGEEHGSLYICLNMCSI